MDQVALILLGFFLFVVLVYNIGFFLILYHLIRFGIGTQPKKYALIFLVGSVLLLFVASIGFLFSLASVPALKTAAQDFFQKSDFKIINLKSQQ